MSLNLNLSYTFSISAQLERLTPEQTGENTATCDRRNKGRHRGYLSQYSVSNKFSLYSNNIMVVVRIIEFIVLQGEDSTNVTINQLTLNEEVLVTKPLNRGMI